MYLLFLACAGVEVVATPISTPVDVETPYAGTEEGCETGVWYVNREPVEVACTGDPFWFLALLNSAFDGDFGHYRSEHLSEDITINTSP